MEDVVLQEEKILLKLKNWKNKTREAGKSGAVKKYFLLWVQTELKIRSILPLTSLYCHETRNG